jgi:hypothetical protein
LKFFAFRYDDEDSDNNPFDIQQFLTSRGDALRTLIVDNCLAHYPDSADSPLVISNLRNLNLSLTITSAYHLNQLLEGGRKLESLRLELFSNGSVISRAFRPHSGPGSFPVLREFAFVFLGVENDDDDNNDGREDEDLDLFPAVVEVVRGHPILEALCLSYRQAEGSQDLKDFGYTAATWGVLPSLVRLRTLSMDVPKDLSSALCGWLVPRTVVALDLRVPEKAAWKIDCAVSMFSICKTSPLIQPSSLCGSSNCGRVYRVGSGF